MNQVIRIIFDDHISHEFAKDLTETLESIYGNMAAIEIYEAEFTDKDNNNGKEQRQKEPE